MLPQVPFAGHVAALQQKPAPATMTQFWFWHWLLVVHGCPFALSEQLLLVVPWQVNGATQSLSAVQVVLHAPLAQAQGEQGVVVVAGAQFPLPSQWSGGVSVDALLHVAAAH